MSVSDVVPRPTVCERLRAGTADAHAALESELDLLGELPRNRLVRALQRFHGFHAGWEPAVASRLPPELWAGRARLPALEADLRRLGAQPDGERWSPPAWWTAAEAPWGSLYVMEGSTLGGQVIGRALRAAGVEGLGYFDGRGREAGPLWRTLRAELDARPDPDRVVAAAADTFEVLRAWMRPAGRAEVLAAGSAMM